MPEDLRELNSILHSGALAYGKWAKAFESSLMDYLGENHLLAMNSYNSAMLVLLATLGLKAGDEVIASPMSCLASNQPFLNREINVVWTDIDPLTGTLEPEQVQKAITRKTKAIFHNHHCGIPGYIDEINEIGRDHGVYVVDDCIEAFGSEYKSKIVGKSADAAIYSFQTVRLPNTIDGGAIVFKDQQLYHRASLIRDYGIDRRNFRDINNEINPHCDISIEGYGALLSDVNAYIGYQQMNDLPKLIKKQRDNAGSWIKFFEDSAFKVKILGRRIDIEPNYWVFSFLSEKKNEMLQYFRDNGYYASGIHINNNVYSAFGKKVQLKGVSDFASRHLALPCGWWMNGLKD